MAGQSSKLLELVREFYEIEPDLENYRFMKEWARGLRRGIPLFDRFGFDGEMLVLSSAVYRAIEEAIQWWENEHPDARPAKRED